MPGTDGRRNYLKRLPPEYYRGQSYVHWSMTIEDRKTDWLKPVFLYKSREVLAHTLFRYAVTCPIFCWMPDHLHMLWIGIADGSDQRNAAKYFRKQLNPILEKLKVAFQRQPYDHVLRDDERERSAFEAVVEYIARNPERAGLVGVDRFRDYPYTGCLVPGYPELTIWEGDYWGRFWRTYTYLREHGLIRTFGEE